MLESLAYTHHLINAPAVELTIFETLLQFAVPLIATQLSFTKMEPLS